MATASAHRQAAFDACQFLIDWLKTKAPFWKREETGSGAHWVDARAGDDDATARWVPEDKEKPAASLSVPNTPAAGRAIGRRH